MASHCGQPRHEVRVHRTAAAAWSVILVSLITLPIGLGASATPASAAHASRGYEMVSPPDKADVDVRHGGQAAVSPEGDRIKYLAWGAFPGAPSSSTRNHYLARRGPAGWSSVPLDAPLPPFGPGDDTLSMFSRDLSKVAVAHFGPPELTPDATPESLDLFIRDNDAGTYELVTVQPPLGTPHSLEPRFVDGSDDLKHVLFNPVEEPVTYFPDAPDFAVYHWTEGAMSVASILPGGTVAPDAGAGSGGRAFDDGRYNDNVISEDGSRIFFTVPHTGGSTRPSDDAQLYVRRNHGRPGADTVHISAPEAGVVDPNGTSSAFFRDASRDGSKVFFTSCERLTADSTADNSADTDDCNPNLSNSDLYVYDLDANGGAGDLVDITTADPAGARVIDVLGLSDSGDRAYFVARGVLDAGATSGAPNLYAWEQDGGVTFIATLDPSDFRYIWEPAGLKDRETRTTPDGRYLAFTSRATLTGYDNAGHTQVYLFDAEQPETLRCVSCNPSGGPARADAWLNSGGPDGGIAMSIDHASLEKRNLAADGSHVFFETAEALVTRDVNNRVDVYEYETLTGEVDLISSGRGNVPSHFTGASSSGRDVFFTTRERLVGWDVDDLIDVYDARVGGGYPEPDPPPPTCGLECQEAPLSPPTLGAPGSSTLLGRGNAVLPPRADFHVPRLSRAQRARLARGQTVALKVRVNRSGKVTLLVRARLGRRLRPVWTRTARASKRATVRIPLRLAGRARRQLDRRGRLKLSVAVRFTGVRTAQRMSLTLRKPSREGARTAATGGVR